MQLLYFIMLARLTSYNKFCYVLNVQNNVAYRRTGLIKLTQNLNLSALRNAGRVVLSDMKRYCFIPRGL
jgi:predicted RNA-binding protein Jag